MAKQLPGSINELRALRGMTSIGTERMREFLAALKRAEQVPEDQLPELNTGQRPHPQLEAVTGLLGVVAQLRAAEHDVSRTYLASREQLAALATWWLRGGSTPPPDIPLLSDWRRELLGNELLDLLQGRLAVPLDATPKQPAVCVVQLGGEVVG
jgi:ribonuclease D